MILREDADFEREPASGYPRSTGAPMPREPDVESLADLRGDERDIIFRSCSGRLASLRLRRSRRSVGLRRSPRTNEFFASFRILDVEFSQFYIIFVLPLPFTINEN